MKENLTAIVEDMETDEPVVAMVAEPPTGQIEMVEDEEQSRENKPSKGHTEMFNQDACGDNCISHLQLKKQHLDCSRI
jgi:hypothetical protein